MKSRNWICCEAHVSLNEIQNWENIWTKFVGVAPSTALWLSFKMREEESRDDATSVTQKKNGNHILNNFHQVLAEFK